MLKLASDADVNGGIVRGLRHRRPEIDFVRSQDALSEGTEDPEVLAWAAAEDRVLITHDRRTMVPFARQRAAVGENTSGVIVTTDRQSIGEAIDEILLIADCMPAQELRDLVVIFLPL